MKYHYGPKKFAVVKVIKMIDELNFEYDVVYNNTGYLFKNPLRSTSILLSKYKYPIIPKYFNE